jgi:membrane fusion protein, copper/silver efflux system
MKTRILLVCAVVAAVVAGVVIGRWTGNEGAADDEAPKPGREILYWVAPMDPNYRRDEPGTSPMGMDLIPVYADEAGREPGIVTIDPTIINNLGVRTAPVERGSLSRRIETVGYVQYDEDTLMHVHTRVDGWIEKLAATAAGDPVRRGQLLFELYSPTLVNAQQEYLAAAGSGNAALRDASRDRLLALGMTSGEVDRLARENEVSQRVRVFAHSGGVIAKLGVREGIFVTPATDIMSIASLDKVWVLAEVFERQAAWVSPGQRATVELDYLPGETWSGTVDYVYPELDPKTRTLKIRLRFDNADERLRPNMFARVTIEGEPTGNVLHVPRAALIRGGKSDRVVVALGDGRFRSQPVRTGIESGDRVVIRHGLTEGEPVVVSGQFLIDSESNIEAALERMQRPDNEPDSRPDQNPDEHAGHRKGDAE